MRNILIRKGLVTDAPALLQLVKELAEYEKAPNAVITEIRDYEKGIDEKLFSVVVAEQDEVIVGMALFFPYFSTWSGKALYLEDFIVKETFRGSGIGQMLFDAFIHEARKQEAKLVKWNVLDWNEPAKNFYRKYPVEFYPGWEIGVIRF